MGKKTSKKVVSKPKAKKIAPARPAKGKGQSTRPAAASASASKQAPEPARTVDASGADEPKRKLGIRGAAPWAARHAAKHAAEARARAAVPPPPGSARATIRIPSGAEEIKAKIVDLHNAIGEIKTLRKNLPANFFEVGMVLHTIQARKLYEARGFGTFEAFLDRELDLGKITSLRLVRIVEVFYREPALEYGLERLLYVMNILEAPDKPVPAVPTPPPAQPAKPALPLHPPMPVKK
ncbi:MAG: hypothetical protein HY898_12745 [Deltaproteobacteria bacterium]|nr:hypothetical protein [Deltaproteobacteria bacterium]